MVTPRSDGSLWVTSAPPIATLPFVTLSRPAIIRNNVDFPQPDGPTNTVNSPASTSRSTPWMTLVSPKDLWMFVRLRSATDISPQCAGSTLRYRLDRPRANSMQKRQFRQGIRIRRAGPLTAVAARAMCRRIGDTGHSSSTARSRITLAMSQQRPVMPAVHIQISIEDSS